MKIMLSYIQVQLIRFPYIFILFSFEKLATFPSARAERLQREKFHLLSQKKKKKKKKKTMRNLAYTIPSSCLFLSPYDQSYSICNISHATSSRTLRMLFILLGVLRVGLDCAFGVCVFPFFFFFFFARVCETAVTVHVLFN